MSFVFFLLLIVAIYGIFKPFKGIKRWQFGVGAVLSFGLIGAFAPKVPNSNVDKAGSPASTETPAPQTTDTPASSGSAAPSDGNKSEWQYGEEEDKMRGSKGHSAHLDAAETVQLDFPYGEQRPFIGIRQSPKYGFDVYYAVPSGQIMCNSFQSTYINIKFDDGPIERFRCVDAEHGSNEVAFFTDAKRILAKLKTSKKAVVEADFYQKGRLQATFNTAGLEWK